MGVPPSEILETRRAAALRAELGTILLRDGSVVTAVAHLGRTTTEQWQAAARAAGNNLQRPVRTGVSTGGTVVWAVVTDWPRTTEELRRIGQRAYAQRRRSPAAEPSQPGKPGGAATTTSTPHPVETGVPCRPGSAGRAARITGAAEGAPDIAARPANDAAV